MRRLRVCVATTVFPRRLGDGEGPFIWQFVKVLRQQQIDVTVVAMHSPGLPTRDNWEGVEILRPPYWWPVGAEMLRKDGGGLPINFRRYPLARAQLPALLAAHGAAIGRAAKGCDLIHAHFTVSAAAALAMRAWHHLPVVTTVHGSDVFQVPKLPLGTKFTRSVLRQSAAVTTVSTALCDACRALDVPPSKVSVISNSVDTTAYAPPAEQTMVGREPLVLFVGSLITRKGVDTLVRAMAQVVATLPGYRLDSVVLSGLSSGCLNKNVRVVLADSSGTSVATGSGTTPGSGTTATISISPGFDMTSTFPAQLTVAVFS